MYTQILSANTGEIISILFTNYAHHKQQEKTERNVIHRIRRVLIQRCDSLKCENDLRWGVCYYPRGLLDVLSARLLLPLHQQLEQRNVAVVARMLYGALAVSVNGK